MKRLAVLVALLCFVLTTVFALEASVSWNWYKNDRNVKFFRYQLDGEDEDNWTIVKSNVLEVSLDVDVSVVHVLYLQQSYDGIHWSESSSTESEIYSEEDFNYDDSYDFDEDSFEQEELPTEEVPEEVETPEQKPEGKDFLNFALSYRNSIPHHTVSKEVGFVASYAHLFPYSFSISDSFASGFLSELGFYVSEEFFSNISKTNTFIVANVQGAMNFSPNKGDYTIGFGPEFQLKLGDSKPVFYVGVTALLLLRFNLTEQYSIGFAAAEHCYFYPEKLNIFDVRASFSMNV